MRRALLDGCKGFCGRKGHFHPPGGSACPRGEGSGGAKAGHCFLCSETDTEEVRVLERGWGRLAEGAMSTDVELPLLSLAKYEAKLPGLEFGVRIMQAALCT